MAQDVAAAWASSLQKQRIRLRSRKLVGLYEELDYNNFRQNLERMQASFRNQSVARALIFLQPTFNRLNTFEKAITSCVQAQTMPASLVWGVLQALLRCACNVLETLDTISTVLEDLTTNLTRINRYVDLLPANKSLQVLSCKIFDDYVHCCITAVKYFRRHPLLHFSKVFFGDPQQPLRDAQLRIRDNIDRFEKESRLDIDAQILSWLPSKAEVHTSIPQSGLFDIPHLRNEYFHGREEVLQDIYSRLHNDRKQHELRSCLVHAMGGMGKTQVTLEYAYRYRAQYHCVFWLGAERVSALTVGYASLAAKLQMPDLENMGQGRRVELVRKWLQTTDTSWLLIFDNVETWESIRLFYPNANGSVLVTSQVQGLTQIIRSSIQLRPMATEEGSGLMLKHLHVEEEALLPEELRKANETVSLLGGMPIAIAHISGVMYDSKMTLSEAIEGLENRHDDLLWSNANPSTTEQYENKLNQVWLLAIKELTIEALDLLYVLAMFNADKIQESILIDEKPLNSHSCGISPTLFRSLRARLARKQLVQRVAGSGKPYLSIHRSLQLNVRHTLSQDPLKRQAIFTQAVTLLRKAFPAQHVTQTPSNESWTDYEEYQPHVLSMKVIFEQTVPALVAPPDFAMLLNDAANYFWELGRYDHSQQMASLAVSIFEQLDQPNLMDLASAYAIWGEAAAEEGIVGRKTWLTCSTKAIDLRKKFLQAPPIGGTYDERLLFANSYNDFGAYLLHVGNYQHAEIYLDHAFALKKAVATEETEAQMFAEAYQNLAVVYAAREDEENAKNCITKAVDLGTKANGPSAATTWTYNFDWANLALARGEFEPALKRHLQVLERRIGIFGKHGCRTRDSYHAVAVAHQGLRQYEQAEKMLLVALDQLGESPWHDAGVARSKYLLAQIYRQQHRQSQADKLEEEAMIMQKTLLREPSEWFSEPPHDQMIVFDYMVCYRAGRASLSKARIKPFDPMAAGIDPTCIEPNRADVLLPMQQAEGRRGKPDGSGD